MSKKEIEKSMEKEDKRKIKYSFIFVGFGMSVSSAFTYEVSEEEDLFLDEAFVKGAEEFVIRYPRVNAAVFYSLNNDKTKNNKKDFSSYIFYDFLSENEKK